MTLSIDNIKKIRDILFFFIVFFIIFDYMPKSVWLPLGIGGPYSKMLGAYPIILGILLTIYMGWKHYIQIYNKYIMIFFCAAFIAYVFSTVHGVFIYPYWSEILNNPGTQFDKISKFMNFLYIHDFDISSKQNILFGISLWGVKIAVSDLVYRFGLSYIIYLWYRDDFKSAWHILTKALLAGLAVFISYGIIDVCFLHGSPMAESILMTLNPLLHDIGKVHDWWPPLLWHGQFRSIFAEPSRVGNYIAFTLPFLFIPIIDRSRYWKSYSILIFVVTYMVFLTNARTAVSMLLGIMGLTFFLLLLLRWKTELKRFLIIIIITFVAFGSSLATALTSTQDDINEVTMTYMENNVGSLASADKRSNQARYALIKSNIKIGLEHPILGVSPLLNGAYVVNHFDDFDLRSKEVQQWIKAYQEMGPLRHNFDAMNEYVTVFSTTGLLGLLFLLTPFTYGCIRLFRQIYKLPESKGRGRLVCLFVSIISSLVAGCNGSLTLIYAVWVLLGMIYIVIRHNDEEKNEKYF